MAFSARSARNPADVFTANIRGGAVTFKDGKGEERSQYEASATGLGGTGKAEGKNISLSLSVADIEEMAADAKAQGFTVLRFTAWLRTPREQQD